MKGGKKQYRYECMGVFGQVNVFFDSDDQFDIRKMQEAYCELENNTCIGKTIGDLYYNGRVEGTLRRECTCMSCFCNFCSKQFVQFFQNGNLVGRVEDFCCSKCAVCYWCGEYYCCFFKRCNILDKDGNRIFSIESRFCQAAILCSCVSYYCCPWIQYEVFDNDGNVIGRCWKGYVPFRCRFMTTNVEPKEMIGVECGQEMASNQVRRDLLFTACIFMCKYMSNLVA